MSIKKRYNFLIYTTLTMALILIIVGILSSGDATSNAISTDEPQQMRKQDPLAKTNKKLIINSYLTEIAQSTRESEILSPKMLETWFKFEVDKIEYVETKKDQENNIYAYNVELKIYNQGADLPAKNGTMEGTEYITLHLIFNLMFSEEEDSYIVESVEIP